MRRLPPYGFSILVLALLFTQAALSQFLTDPQPGEVWREYSRVLTGDKPPRVTDPNATNATARTYLPNPVNSLTLGSMSNVVRAEFVASIWGGHVGTTGKKFRFNGGPWITIPEMGTANGIPAGTSGQCYMQQLTYVISFPSGYLNPANSYALKQGTNTFEGTSGGQTCYNFNWGQWMWYEVMVRVYHSPGATPHATGTVSSPGNNATIGENPTIAATTSGSATQVDFLAYYDGIDTDGDGVFLHYHHAYHRTKTETAMLLKQHVGSDNAAPFAVTWNTNLVPNQASHSIKFKARIKDNTNTWYMTPEVTGVSLQRSSSYVRMYKTTNMPERAWVRSGRTTKTVNFTIPSGDNLANASSVTLVVPTWNGDDVSERPLSWMKVNSYTLPYFGQDHYYSLDFLTIPKTALVQGTNSFTIYSSTIEHGIELLWPGPMVVIRYGGNPVNLPPSITQQPLPQTVSVGQSATFSVQATGTAPLAYQWQKNGQNVSGATSASYTTPPVTTSDNGATFRCVVSNPYGTSTSNSAVLTVGSGNLPPTISQQPQSQTVGVSQTATFSVGVTGTAPFTYQWQKNGANISGANAASYTTPPATLNDNGATFRCIVTNSFGNATSNNATLTVTSTPPAGNLVQNPGFESGTAPWRFFTDGVGTLASVTPGFAGLRAGRVVIATPGSNVQLYQTGFSLQAGARYRLTFSAYSSTGHDLSVSIHRNSSPFTNYGLSNVVFNLTTGYQTFTREFTAGGFTGTTTDTRLRFWLAPYDAAGDQYFFDEVKLERISTTTDDPAFTSEPEPREYGLPGEGGIAEEFSLTANYPNPFNPSTTISFSLPEAAEVRLAVYNTLGQEVAVLADGSLGAGWHSVVWDASRSAGAPVSSGVYFYRMTASGISGKTFSSMQKMVLMK